MKQVPFIFTEWQEINSLLYAPLSATKKVQYTCMTVSNNYIILGAISGSIYLFTREPCTFQQLFPLSEGAVNRAQISPDEKIVALATVKGSVCLVSLKPNVKLMFVSTEHLREKVTCLCWNDDGTEVYVGDERGKVSVLVVSNFMMNGVFPSPSYALMNLDSKIVQMNYVLTLLLISTLNRCYICDTVQEQYKQIGNKPRDGEFGACFLQTHSTDINVPEENKKSESFSNSKGLFSISRELNDKVDCRESLPKIFCARPGSRLWEVYATGVVIKTHQFKEALAIPPLPVYKPTIGRLLRLKKQNQVWPVQSISFAQLMVISNKYLFSYTSKGLYVLDPENAEVILWNDEFPDIFIAQIINDKIYLMTSSGVFHCLTLTSVDILILKLYEKKLYQECWEVCQTFRSQLMDSLEKKSCDLDENQSIEFPDTLIPIINIIQSTQNTQPVKLESGIVLVNPGNTDNTDFYSAIDSELEHLNELDDLLISLTINGISKAPTAQIPLKEANSNSNTSNGLSHTTNSIMSQTKNEEVSSFQATISNIQTDLELLSVSVNSNLRQDLNEEQLEQTIKLINESLNNIKEKYEVSSELKSYLFEVIRSAELHYYNTLLESLCIEFIHKLKNQEIVVELVKIVVDVNSFKYIECCCGFPYPIFGTKLDKFLEPMFLDIGKVLLYKLCLDECDNTSLQMCNQIPYLWRDYLYLKGYTEKRIPDNLLKQCLQTRDNLLFATVLPLLDEQQWKIVANCFENIQSGRCINCNKSYNSDQISTKEFVVDWHGITQLIIKQRDIKEAMIFLFKVNKNLPQVSFDKRIYQSIIFSSILNRHGVKHAIELHHSNLEQSLVCSPKILQDVIKAAEKDLEEPVNKELFGSGPHHWGMRYNPTSSVCPCCTLSLQTPVLLGNNGIALFPCGHAYHVNCMIQKKISKCNLHTQ